MKKRIYRIENLNCADCAKTFEKNLNKLPQVDQAIVNLATLKLSISGLVSQEEIEEAGAFENIKVYPEGNKVKIYSIENLDCANCAKIFEENLNALSNVDSASVNFASLKLEIKGDVSKEEIERAGEFEGIKVHTSGEKPLVKEEGFFEKYRKLIFSGILIFLGFLSQSFLGSDSLLTASFFILAILISGLDIFKKGFKNLSRFEFTMETLMTLAIIGAVLIGEWTEGSMVVILFSLSEKLEEFSVNRARNSLQELLSLAPDLGLVRREGQEQTLPVEEIQIEDVVLVKPGQKIPMDGIVIKGSSSVNEAAITGESLPLEKGVDDEVFAGSLNEEGYLEILVTKKSKDTVFSKIIRLVEDAQVQKAPAQKFVDLFSKIYTPIIILIALLIILVPPLVFKGSWDKWIYQGLSVLVVGCPCALVISTPASIVSAISNAAKNGIVIKGGIYLEEIGKSKVFSFDKTGTLTQGKPYVTDYILLDPKLDQREVFSMISSMESQSQHPLARAILEKAEKEGIISDYFFEDFQSITGQGIQGRFKNKVYAIGKASLFSEEKISPTALQSFHQLQDQGKTTVFFGTVENPLALIAIADQLRPGAAEAIEELKKAGVDHTLLITGDNKVTAQVIGKEAGIDEIQAELMPEDKLRIINELQEKGHHTVMVGDGVNDAPALATASVGIAMGAGTDTALETADVTLMGNDLEKIPFLYRLSRKTMSIIRQNIAFSLGLKILALLLVIPGWLTLWIAVIADAGATFLVTLNSLRLLKVK